VEFKIRFSKTALTGLEEILAYSWAHFPKTTQDFAATLYDHIEELKQFPYMGRPTLQRKGARQLVHTPLLVYYRVHETDGVIEILEIRHSARRLSRR